MTGRIVIGGTDCTEAIRATVDQAPPLNPAQCDQLRLLFAGTLPAKPSRRATRRPRPAAVAGQLPEAS